MTTKKLHIPIHKEVSTPSTNPPSGYSKIYPKSDGVWYRLDPSGNEVPLGIQSIDVANTLFVDITNGNNSTAQVGRQDLPYATLGAARTAASSGDTIVVRPGTYSGTNLLKDGVNWVFEGVGTVTGSDIWSDLGSAVTSKIFAPGWTFAGTSETVNITGQSFVDIVFDEITSSGNIGIFMNPSNSNNYCRFIGNRCYGFVYGFNIRSLGNCRAEIYEIEANAIALFFRSGATQFGGEVEVNCPNVNVNNTFGTSHVNSFQTSDIDAKLKVNMGWKDDPAETDTAPLWLVSAGKFDLTVNAETQYRSLIDANTLQSTNQGEHTIRGKFKVANTEAILIDQNGKDIILDDLDIIVENFNQVIRLRDNTGNLYIKKARILNEFATGDGILIQSGDPTVVIEDALIQVDSEPITAGSAKNVKIFNLVTNNALSSNITNLTPNSASSAIPTIDDKNLTSVATTTDGDVATLSTITNTPVDGSYVTVYYNGVEYEVGDGVDTTPFYFSPSASPSLPRGFSSSSPNGQIQAGDVLLFNPSVAGFNLQAGKRISLHYVVATAGADSNIKIDSGLDLKISVFETNS